MTDRIYTPDGDRRRSLFDRKAEYGVRQRETDTGLHGSARGAISHALAPAGARDRHDPAAPGHRAREKARPPAVLIPPSRTVAGDSGRIDAPRAAPRSAPPSATQGAEAPAVAAPVRIAGAAGLGVLVRERRARRGLTQQQLADLAGLGRRFVSELEAGKTTLEFDRVVQCCAALGIDLVARSRS